ncbi:adrenocortical dysplasia protein homolog [Hypomesus transpacificus]|uniref:adrenocortical dysplasia protein homolog n=1 Tax=Hypomesus transpacificus TaxID=137520 RepID=UPI001F07BEA7|nr:adrenocortical dysplasia protein homolog [Hypomesus transpacificus]
MSRGRRAQLAPWIEHTILNYGTKENGRLWAHVVGVGQMTESQAQDVAVPTMVLFLSDGVVQIPALLRQQAWDTLQEQEERECLSSLSNCTVCVVSYSLQFHRAHVKTKCRFFLWIDELITTAYGAPKDSPPCCTTLPSVQQQIYDTWRSLSNQDSVHTENVFSLSELLGEWKDERREQLLQEVGQLLKVRSSPSGWAADRLTYQEEEVFCVPVSHLLIPQELHLSDEGSCTQSGLVPPSEDVALNASRHGETVRPITDQCNRLAEMPAPLERIDSGHEVTLPSYEIILSGPEITLPVHGTTHSSECLGGEGAQAGGKDIRDNPWDMFAPAEQMLRTSSSSDLSMASELREESLSLLEPPLVPPAPVPMATSTQVPSQKSGVSQKSEDRSLPPYQRPCPSYNLAPSCHSPCIQAPNPPLQPHPFEQERVGWVKRRHRKNTNELLTAAPLEEEAEQQVISPPSWLFESLLVPRSRGEGPGCKPSAGPEDRHTNVHSDGTLFLYSYQPSDKLRQDLYQLKVPDSLLDWAVKYLLPAKQTDVAKATQQ